MEKQESGTGTETGTWIETGVNWEALKPVPDCSRYPCGNKIQDGILCYHCFEKFSAQWSWYQRYTHIRKVTCKKKGKCILLLFLAVINCDCSCRSSNFRQIETTTNQKPIDCEKQPLLVCDVPLCYSFPSLEPKLLISFVHLTFFMIE